jgi:hypothetical protein
MTAAHALFAVVFGAAGLLAGRVHFRLLGRSVDALTGGRAGTLPLAAPLLRVAVTGATLAAAAGNGGISLLAAFAGFLAARVLALRESVRTTP